MYGYITTKHWTFEISIHPKTLNADNRKIILVIPSLADTDIANRATRTCVNPITTATFHKRQQSINFCDHRGWLIETRWRCQNRSVGSRVGYKIAREGYGYRKGTRSTLFQNMSSKCKVVTINVYRQWQNHNIKIIKCGAMWLHKLVYLIVNTVGLRMIKHGSLFTTYCSRMCKASCSSSFWWISSSIVEHRLSDHVLSKFSKIMHWIWVQLLSLRQQLTKCSRNIKIKYEHL